MSVTRYTVDLDGDVEMSIPQPIFEVIRAPELSSWDHAALIEWHREWERYVEKIRHRCTTTGETYENVVVTVKGSAKRKTLKNLAMYVLKKPVDDVTDADIMSAVQARCRTLKNEFVPDVTSLFRQSLRMDLSVDDCDARVFRYYEDFNGIGDDNGLQGLIGAGSESDTGYKSRMKVRCRLFVENLQPPVLKAQISRLIELERRDCKSDDVALFDLILEHAKVQQRFHRMSQDMTAKRDVKTNKQVRQPQRSSDGGSRDGASRVSAPAPWLHPDHLDRHRKTAAWCVKAPIGSRTAPHRRTHRSKPRVSSIRPLRNSVQDPFAQRRYALEPRETWCE
ncbi:hypothetical protein PF008_g8718 [Phytophthora fragariae]|uniref:Uncharacterized protein n=1 Tax=Phytophthora fragariae TaxID=53985 RepID=A0A6G0RYP7_9STRA|nr:hypothetical protein PF008_g8718 [Phytophthora fragariae]